MSMLDRIREKQGHLTVTKNENIHKQPNKPQNTTKSPTGSVTFACGHTKPLAHIAVKVCGSCREKAKQERDRLAREQRSQRKQQGPKAEHGWKERASTNLARLPHGSRFNQSTYDDVSKTWSGSLIIPGEWLQKNFPGDSGEDLSFFATEVAVFKLLNALDGKWRDYLERRYKQTSQEAEKVEDVTPQPCSDSSGELVDSIADYPVGAT